jgi:hypothetical protein
MKVRFTDRFIRCRLSLEDVLSLEMNSNIALVLPFLAQSFSISLSSMEDISKANVRQNNAHLQIDIPREWTRDWANNDRVGFDFMAESSSGQPLRIVIEKDFPCEHGPDSKSTAGIPTKMD